MIQGPEKEVYFEQVHTPGERAQSDFTHMEEFKVTIAGEAFPHLLYHCVLTYSNVEAVSVCFAETFEALAEGIKRALWWRATAASDRPFDGSRETAKETGAGRMDAALRRAQERLTGFSTPSPSRNNA